MRTIRCWQLRTVLTSYVDDEMAAEERVDIERHLERCDVCRDRVSRERAVRQRLRRWSDELRRRGALPSSETTRETPAPHHGRALLRLGVVATAVIAFVLVARAFWLSGDTVAFAAFGHLTDSRCASGHQHNGPALANVSGGDCVRRCVETGARYVFVSQGVVYEIVNQGFADLAHWAGRNVQVEGNLRQNVLTVSHVRALAGRRSHAGSHPGIGGIPMITRRIVTAIATAGILMPIVHAQRETPPAGVANYTRVDATVACAGATPVEALPQLKKDGFAAVINFRTPQEQGANIDAAKAMAAKVGLSYIHLPFQTPTPEIATAFLEAVADPSNQPVYIHCGSANRVGAMWFIKRVRLDGWDVDRAMKEAEAIGLRAPALKEFALTYVGAKR